MNDKKIYMKMVCPVFVVYLIIISIHKIIDVEILI